MIVDPILSPNACMGSAGGPMNATLCGSLKRARLDVARCQAMKQLVHVCRLDTFNMPHEEELDEDGDLRMQHTLSAGHGHGHGQHAGGAGKHASGAGGDTPADEDALQVSAVVPPGSTRDWFSDAWLVVCVWWQAYVKWDQHLTGRAERDIQARLQAAEARQAQRTRQAAIKAEAAKAATPVAAAMAAPAPTYFFPTQVPAAPVLALAPPLPAPSLVPPIPYIGMGLGPPVLVGYAHAPAPPHAPAPAPFTS
jgi:hypothetical protein